MQYNNLNKLAILLRVLALKLVQTGRQESAVPLQCLKVLMPLQTIPQGTEPDSSD